MSAPVATSAPVQADRHDMADDVADGMTPGEMLSTLRQHLGLLIAAPLAAGVLALGVTYLITPTFTASTSFIDRKSTRLNSSHLRLSRMPSSA